MVGTDREENAIDAEPEKEPEKDDGGGAPTQTVEPEPVRGNTATDNAINH